MKMQLCKECGGDITDKTRSKFCKACRGPSTHNAKPRLQHLDSLRQPHRNAEEPGRPASS